MLYATKQLKVTENYLLFASNCLERPMNTADRAFSPATPIDHTYQCHVLFPLRMLDLKIGKGRPVIPSASMHTGHYYITALVHCSQAYLAHEARYPTLLLMGAMARRVCALESSSFNIVL